MQSALPIDPQKLKKWLIVLAIAYLLFPRDLIPDFFGRGLGLIDDALLIAFLTWFYRKRLREFAARATGASSGPGPQQRTGHARATPSDRSPEPYATLGVLRSASREDIAAAYKARMSEYHPDKVAHLGEELQQLAHRKALEIQQAYQQLRK
jgi:DnaJ like chaperone protein